MQSPFTNICEAKWVFLKKLYDSKHGTVIGCHLRNETVCEIPVGYSTVNYVIFGKWNHSRTTATHEEEDYVKSQSKVNVY